MNAKRKTTPKGKIGRPTVEDDEKLGRWMHVRLDVETDDRLSALAARMRHVGVLKSALIRMCLALGLAAAEKDPAVLLSDAAAPTRKAKRRAKA